MPLGRFFLIKLEIIGALLGLLACSSPQWQSVGHVPTSLTPLTPRSEYSLQPGDDFDLKFLHNPELNERVIINPEGYVRLPLIGDVLVAGLTLQKANEKLSSLYAKELRRPELSVIMRGFSGNRVYVGGEVNQPKEIPLCGSMDALQAIFQAGGLKNTARLDSVILIRRGRDNRPEGSLLNLAAFINGAQGGSNAFLQGNDIIVVPKTNIAKVNDFVDNYIRKVLPFTTGANFTAFYEVGKVPVY